MSQVAICMINEQGELYTFSEVQESNFMWARVDDVSITGAVNSAYTEVIHWCWNVFKVPSGKTGKPFAAEMSCLLHAYAYAMDQL